MSVTGLLKDLKRLGVHLRPHGVRLTVDAPRGVLTPDLRRQLVDHKAELLAVLSGPRGIDPRDRVQALAADEGLSLELIARWDEADLAACVGLDDATLRASLRLLARSAQMDAGHVPDEYTQPGWCNACGWVWLWPGVPAQLIACPWCFRRRAGKPLPRPPVTCGQCRHFVPDPGNPAGAVGECARTVPLPRGAPRRYPGALRVCPEFWPRPRDVPPRPKAI